MLPREKRLNLKKDFTWVAAGEKSGNQFVKLFFRFGRNTNPRIGIATSKNTFKEAVKRNRAKRLVSSAFEQLYSQLVPSVNIIVLPKMGVLQQTSQQITDSLKDLLEKHRLLND